MTGSLSSAELSEFRTQLRVREGQLLDELHAGRQRSGSESFQQTASEVPDAGDSSVADIAADQLSAERQRNFEELQDVQDALTRLEDGSFGICLNCGKLIDRERLRAFPTAKYDLEHQEEIERRVGSPASATL
jgi:DnaK suppressor protein